MRQCVPLDGGDAALVGPFARREQLEQILSDSSGVKSLRYGRLEFLDFFEDDGGLIGE